MAGISNHDRMGKALDLVAEGVTPFVKRELQTSYQGTWRDQLMSRFSDERDLDQWLASDKPWDPHLLFKVMLGLWNEVFRRTLGQSDRSLVFELRDFRNQWAHRKPVSMDDALRCMDSAERLLSAISAPQASQMNNERMRLLRERFQQEKRDERKKASLPGLEGQPASHLKSWREIVTPHEDVASGRFQQAEFAADLWQVYRGEAKEEYGDAVRFFSRTYMTDGLKDLMTNALKRLCQDSGDPIVELQTNFGGGKTHSMLALFHLFSGTPFAKMQGVEDLARELKIEQEHFALRRAVLVGIRIAPGQPSKKADGTLVHTLWGELAWQLAGKDGYERVRQADESASNPGEALHQLIAECSPCLILVDEWVAYARQLHDAGTLCGGSFETQFTFAQNLTETVKNVDQAMLVVSIPASDTSGKESSGYTDIEVGGERGEQALHRLKNVIGRTESAWRPASQEESYHIVRRRLFNDIQDAKLFRARDAVIEAFSEMYGQQAQEFPSRCRESEYKRRMHACYPIHPDLFDRLYNDWSSLERFQRTRGVLRLMASVIHCLWDSQDASLMIMPASIPIDDSRVQPELTRYLTNNWVPVIERDVDGPNAISRRIDQENPNLGRCSAARRVARTIYMASAPTATTKHKGADDQHVKLGCVMPGESAAIFGDALRRLSDSAMHLYVDKNRYWFDTQPTVQRLARDRANSFKPEMVREQVVELLQAQGRNRADFVRVHVCPSASSDVVDERSTRLVILGPDAPYERNRDDAPALEAARDILENRGNSPRQYRNTLVFLAAETRLVQSLNEAVRMVMAWQSINADKGEDGLDLAPGQARQVAAQLKTAENTAVQRLMETYRWLLVPGKATKTEREIQWSAAQVTGQDELTTRASKRLVRDQSLYTVMNGTVLKTEIDMVPLWEGNHVKVRDLAEHFAKLPYLPRLRDESVLVEAIADGTGLLTWQSDTFAYADRYDEEANRYAGLRTGTSVAPPIDGEGVLVKSKVAADQLARELTKEEAATGNEDVADLNVQEAEVNGIQADGAAELDLPHAKPPEPKRFFGTVSIDAGRMNRDAGKIAEEVVQHLVKQLGSEVDVTIEIAARSDKGYSQDIVRIVSENARALKFDTFGFEEE